MVIDYAIDELENRQRRLQLRTIARSIGAHPEAGTPPGNIEHINTLLKDSFPEIQIEDSIGGSFQLIKEEIDEKRPVIAWIKIAEDEGDILYHSIVVNGYDDDLTTIYYIDPEQEQHNYQLSVPIGTFIDEKLTVDGHLIRMKTTIKGQQDLFKRLHPLSETRTRRRKKNE